MFSRAKAASHVSHAAEAQNPGKCVPLLFNETHVLSPRSTSQAPFVSLDRKKLGVDTGHSSERERNLKSKVWGTWEKLGCSLCESRILPPGKWRDWGIGGRPRNKETLGTEAGRLPAPWERRLGGRLGCGKSLSRSPESRRRPESGIPA